MPKPTGIVGTTNAQEAAVVKAATKESFEFFTNVLGKWAKFLLTFLGEATEVLGKSLMKNALCGTAESAYDLGRFTWSTLSAGIASIGCVLVSIAFFSARLNRLILVAGLLLLSLALFLSLV